MRKEAAVQSACFPIVVTADDQGCSRGPEDGDRFIVLPVVGLHHTHQAATAIGIAQRVDEATCCTGILILGGRPLAAYLGLQGSHLGMLLQAANQRVKPAWSDPHIAVKQYIHIGLHLPQRLVVALGKAVIALHLYNMYAREIMLQHLQRLVGAAIVGHYHLGSSRIFEHGWQEAAHHAGTVPVENDYACLHKRVP